MGAEKGYDTDESWDEDSDEDFDDMDDGDFDLDTADPDEEDIEPTLQTVQAYKLGQDDAVIPYPRLYQRTFRKIKRMDETPYGSATAFLLALKLRLEVSYGRFEGEFLAREVDKFITTRLFQERNDAEGKHSLDHAGAILYLNEINRTSPSRNIFDELRYPVDFLDRLFALAHRSIRQTYRGTVLLAVCRRFPLEICENILD